MTTPQSPGSLSQSHLADPSSSWDKEPQDTLLEHPINDQACQELYSLVNLFRKLSIHMLAEVEKTVHQLKPDLLEIALLICEKFLYKKLENPEELTLLISTALQRHTALRALTPIKVFLHPEDLKMLKEWIATHEFPMIKHAEFLSDPCCKQGGFKIETPEGIFRQEIGEELDHLLSVLTA
ncbi:Flagellar assembly protein FliH [Chlamydia serpentis]|uniref:Flagellar assembly protein FliH n=1 Tax=Chlamydia serpentis TaxID=1967782 RepID=A0A2R8FC78_9CHLA|nr:FliH/SctL family protein [Chlamydia serpentis]SPN73971.1 Flagellar assembly protein FliH [Chlamydia serpentis]